VTPGGGERKATAARGLLGSLMQLARTFFATLHSRAELFALEAARERARVVRLVLLALAALFCMLLAAITATLFIIAAFWDSHRLIAIGLLTFGYAGIGVGLVIAARKEAARASHPFSSTLEQLRKDRDAFL
jgi:uncharacterized membrane protein YqjE